MGRLRRMRHLDDLAPQLRRAAFQRSGVEKRRARAQSNIHDFLPRDFHGL
jgi:hypothetical protein